MHAPALTSEHTLKSSPLFHFTWFLSRLSFATSCLANRKASIALVVLILGCPSSIILSK